MSCGFYAQKNSIRICAVRILRNIVRGYTVEYPIAGASFPALAFANARAGGSVVAPDITPASTK